MTLQEKLQAVKNNINTSQLAIINQVKELKEHNESLILKLENEYDMPSQILRELRDDNEAFTLLFKKHNIIDICS